MRKITRAVLAACSFVLSANALAFSFSEEEQNEAAAEKARQARAAAGGPKISQACRDSLAGKKVMVVMGARQPNGYAADQSRFGPHFNSIDRRLKAYGVKTFTQEEIRSHIAQGEVEAYFRNDLDAALAASNKMGAQLVLRGAISSRSAINPVLHIPEVYVSINFALLSAGGETISEAGASSESYSGTDTYGMAATLVEEQAGGVVSRLISGYCRQFGAAGRKTGGN
ncbi:MAG: hypothetical protein KF778_10075 [Rhodocyclaceae bacterium]|nr:hypothetical protein [Rhodocyclaceae bacterium]MBX3668736.1 hypothetical protein [Rhodocyclaceae bacterium]